MNWIREAVGTIIDWIRETIEEMASSKKAKYVQFWCDGQILGGKHKQAEITLRGVAPRHIDLRFVDAKGQPARVDGVPQVVNQNPGVYAVKPDAMGYAFDLQGKPGVTGDGRVRVTADADLGKGVRRVTDALNVHVVGQQAKHIQFI